MGGYNIGELFASLKLDDVEFQRALQAAGGTTRLLSMDINKLSTNYQQFLTQLQQSGYGFQNVAKWMDSMRAQGYSASAAIRVFSQSLEQAQKRATEFHGPEIMKQMNLAYKEQAEQIRNLNASANASDKERLSSQQRYVAQSESAWAEYEAAKSQSIKRSESELAQATKREMQLHQQEVAAAKEAAKSVSGQIDLSYRERTEQIKAENTSARDLARDRAANERMYLSQTDAAWKEYSANKSKAEKDANKQSQDALKRQLQMHKEEVSAARQAAQDKIDLEKKVADHQYNLQEKARRQATQAEHQRYFQYREMNAAAMSLTTVGMAVGAAGAVPLAGMLFAAKEAKDFQDAMQKSLSIMDDVSEGMRNRLARAAREAAKETGLAAKDIAANIYVIKSAGVETEEGIITLTRSLAKFAVASNSNLESTSRMVLSAMNALRIPATQVPALLDKLVMADKIAQGSAAEFAQAIQGKAAGSLRLYSKSLEEGLALQMLFIKNGLSASEANTALVRMTQSLTRSVQQHGDVVTNIGKTWRQVVYDQNGGMRSYGEQLKDLYDMTQKMSASQKADLFTMLGLNDRARAADIIKMVIDLTGTLRDYEKSLQNAGGTMENVFEKRMDSAAKKWDQAKARFTDMAISLGTVVVAALVSVGIALEPLLKDLEGLVSWFTKLPQPLQQVIVLGGLGAFAFTSLAGGILTTAGAAVRLAADLEFLGGMKGLGGIVGIAGSAATKIGAMAFALITLAAAAQGIMALVDAKGRERKEDDNVLTMANAWPSNAALQAEKKKILEKRAKEEKTGIDGYMQSIKKDIESTVKSAMDSIKGMKLDLPGLGDIGFSDPKAIAKDRASTFSALGLTDYKKQIEEATEALKTLKAHQKEWGVTDQEIALAAGHVEELKQKWQQAGEAVRGFAATNTYATELLKAKMEELNKHKSDLLKESITMLMNYQKFMETGWQESIGEMAGANREAAYKYLDGIAEGAKKATEEMDKLLGAWEKAGLIAPAGPASEFDRIKAYAKTNNVGIIFQEDLEQQAGYARKVWNDLNAYRAEGWKVANETMLSATKAMIDAEARARHMSAAEYARQLGYDYEALSRSVEDSVKQANSAWKRSMREIEMEIGRILRTFSRGVFDILWPADSASQVDKLAPLVTAFRGAFEKLSAYSDPAKALKDVIESIRTAGTEAQANAIAVRYFGETLGPQLAKEMRNGTISVGQINDAMKRATASTLEYEQQTEKSTSKLTKLWRDTMREIAAAIMKHAIEGGLVELLKVTGMVNSKTETLGDAMKQVWDKIKGYIKSAITTLLEWIGVLHKAGKAAAEVAVSAGGSAAAGAAGSAAAGTAGSAAGSAAGSVAGGAASAGTSLAGSFISGGLAMLGGIIGGVLNMRQEGTLNAVELNTRESAIFLGKGDSIHSILKELRNRVYDWTAGGYGWSTMIELMVQLTDKFIWGYTPKQLALAGVSTVAGPAVSPEQLASPGSGSTAGDTMYIENVTVKTDDPEQFVRRLKSRRIVKSR